MAFDGPEAVTLANAKNLLQEYWQQRTQVTPVYNTRRMGLEHSPMFVSQVTLPDGQIFEGAMDISRKNAEKQAALVAYNVVVLGFRTPGVPHHETPVSLPGHSRGGFAAPAAARGDWREPEPVRVGTAPRYPPAEPVASYDDPYRREYAREYAHTGGMRPVPSAHTGPTVGSHYAGPPPPAGGYFAAAGGAAAAPPPEARVVHGRDAELPDGLVPNPLVTLFVDLENQSHESRSLVKALLRAQYFTVHSFVSEGHALEIEATDVVPGSNSNTADVALIMKAAECALAAQRTERPSDATFVIVSGDTNFAPALVEQLARTYGLHRSFHRTSMMLALAHLVKVSARQ
eukprot:c33550_g1_i1.p1 GENE.c33550_g1_i1~~c33550_g1_i1.p1  ORF type:complete len:396 (-),score=62.91 c33550_g1_i1:242-1276(-)